MQQDTLVFDLTTRTLSLIIFIAGLFFALLWAMPYARYPGYLVAQFGQIHPLLGATSALIGLIGIFKLGLDFNNLFTKGLNGIHAIVRRVALFILKRF